jgi:hypothetical protein
MSMARKTHGRGAVMFAGIGGATLILALVVADAGAIGEAYRFFVLSQRGRPIEGIVEGLRIETRGGPGSPCPRHHVLFTYIVRNEKRIENHIVHGDEVVSATTFRSLHMGEILPVIHDPSNSKTYLVNFANRIRTDNPLQVWWRANDQTRCPEGASASH